jgi:predicted ATP-grasp superfamily ATP-dependent carboligase
MNICLANNLPHPRTASLSKMTLEDAALNVGFPSLIKPNISAGALGIKYVNNLTELIEKYGQTQNDFGESTLQEYVNHSDHYFNVMIFRYENGEFSPATTIKILRYFPIKGGSSSYSVVIENAELTSICKRTLNCLNWHGFADFDFIQDKNSKEFKLIEINPRIPSCLHAAYISGINYPEIMLYDCLNKTAPESNYIPDKKLRYFSLDVLWFIFSKNRFRSKPSWFKFFANNLHFQDGSLSDPMPVFAGIFMGIIKYTNPAFRRGKLKT